MKNLLKVLVADDDKNHRKMLSALLSQWGYGVLEASDGLQAVKYCNEATKSNRPDLVILDVRMPGMDGLEALRHIHAANVDMPILIMTAYSEISAAVEAMRNGAYDYLTKPLDFVKLKTALSNASMIFARCRKDSQQFSANITEQKKESRFIGISEPMLRLSEMIRIIAPTEATVLFTGESGTGKELAAKELHKASNRAKGPFVAVNCGAFTESLLSSELFGHEKGAFTGADKKHAGLFLQATGGSIFLDEIGEMPLNMQVKLLRVIQEREVLSVGGAKPVAINCRIMAATNRDLAKEVLAGRFREDLYYRLNVVSLQMPPLRERIGDLPMLAKHFAERFAKINSKNFKGISNEAIASMEAYNWPGNVRELENVMERAIILMPGEYIDNHELPDRILEYVTNDAKIDAGSGPPARQMPQHNIIGIMQQEPNQDNTSLAIPTLEEVERTVILQTLKRFGNNKTETAKALGITRKTLHAKLNRYREER